MCGKVGDIEPWKRLKVKMYAASLFSLRYNIGAVLFGDVSDEVSQREQCRPGIVFSPNPTDSIKCVVFNEI